MEHSGFVGTLCKVDALVTGKPAVIVRIVPQASVDDGDVTIYDGRGTDGRSLGIYYGLKKQTLGIELGIECEQGIYVDIGTSMTSCLVVWYPLSEV